MKYNTNSILKLPENIKQDVLEYRSHVDEYLAGKVSGPDFRSYRVPMGIYEQRTTGNFMVRIRIGAGILTANQGRKIADLSKEYGDGIVHITTRQDIQIHAVKIENTSDVLEQLLGVGLATRGGGGNTVRNVTACPCSGVCPNEKFNVAPYAIATAEYLLQNKDSFTLPRKYKIVFSGCSEDCALASVADLGFFANIQNDTKGFSVYAAGGLGSSPSVAVKIEDFIENRDIFLVAETIRQLFDEHGDRANRNKARLRYVLKRLGKDEFVKLYKSYKEKVKKQGLPGLIPEIRETLLGKDLGKPQEDVPLDNIKADILKEKRNGYFTVRLNIQNGDIPADDFIIVTDIAEQYGSGSIRTSQLQNLRVSSVPATNLNDVDDALEKLSIDVAGRSKSNIVACTGASTCKLGFCQSRGLALAVSEKFTAKDISPLETIIRISGCPNSCGNHHIAAIGFQGRAKRINDRLMPCYDIFANGKTYEGKAQLAQKIATVPAKSIPDMLVEVFTKGSTKKDVLKEITSKYEDFTVEFSDDYLCDYGKNKPFTLPEKS